MARNGGRLAPEEPLAHSPAMTDEHHFTIRVEPDLLREGHFRWALCESGQDRQRSEEPYTSKGEAYAAAAKVLREYLANWRPPDWKVS
jgi:hypothetical protein